MAHADPSDADVLRNPQAIRQLRGVMLDVADVDELCSSLPILYHQNPHSGASRSKLSIAPSTSPSQIAQNSTTCAFE